MRIDLSVTLCYAVMAMEQLTPAYYYYGLCFSFALLVHVLLRYVRGGAASRPRLPPGPWQLPVIGSLHHLLRGLPHHTMRDLSLRHGPLMLLRVCERVIVVVSSAEALREIFKGHDADFSERPSSPSIDEISRNGQGVIFAPYGDHWRLLRRILMTELLSARRLEAFRRIREEEAAGLVSSLMQTAATAKTSSVATSPNGGGLVNIDERLAEFMTSSAVRSIFGDCGGLPERAAFMKMVKQGTDLSSLFDLRDLFPSSRLVRLLQPRIGGKAERHRREMFRLIDNILEDHERRRTASGHGEQDMVDVLLAIRKEDTTSASLTDGVVGAMLTDVLGATLDTTTTTLQWAMAELMANPSIMHKAQSETRAALAGHSEVHEAALGEGIHYIRAIIKETLRLHPPAPFFPRLCLRDTKVQGHDVPRGVILLTNVWAISRDPKHWEQPDSFFPERFEGAGGVDFKGADFEFTPFGVGRRICPGVGFASKNAEIALASLLYHFDWELPAGVEPRDIDMTEAFGATVRRKTELFLRPIPRFPLSI